jgi:tetratricopeptide (TPR) repeat protein
MKDVWENSHIIIILLFGVIIALLGISPLSKSVIAGFDGIRVAKEYAQPEIMADKLLDLAEQQPWQTGFWEAAGYSALNAGDFEMAGNCFAHAAAKGQLSVNGYVAWGDADWKNGNYQTALQIWEIADRLGAAPKEILKRKMEALRFLGEDLALIDTLQSILNSSSIDDYPSESQGTLNQELGLLLAAYEPASAVNYFTRAIELDPELKSKIRIMRNDIQQAISSDDSAYLLLVSGRTLANQDYWTLAEKAFTNATELNPEYAEAWAYLGEAQQHIDQDVEPLTALKKALELDPDSLAANTFLALYWQRKGEYEFALRYLQNASDLDPGNPAYFVEIGQLVALLGDLRAGEAFYWQAYELSSGDPKYVREFIKFSIQFNLDLRTTALPMARQLVMDDPGNPISLDLMGEILLRLGDMLNAERFFLRAIEIDPDFDQAYLHLGEFYQDLGQHELARYYLAKVLEVSTNPFIIEHAHLILGTDFTP